MVISFIGKLGKISISELSPVLNTEFVSGKIIAYNTGFGTMRVIANLTAVNDIPQWSNFITNLGWSGINKYFSEAANQFNFLWNGDRIGNASAISKGASFSIDIEEIWDV